METAPYEIVRINENSWRIEDNGVRFFLLTGTERALLVDSGRDVHSARDIAATLTQLPLSLLNTHADADHVASNGQFDAFYMHPDEEPNYRRGQRPGTLLPVREGDVLELGGRPLEVIHLPGHTPGSIALLDRNARVLISGDPIQDGRVFMFGPLRNMDRYIRSLEHLRAWDGAFDEIWPSHGSIPVAPALIEKLHDGALAVQAGAVPSRPAELYGTPIRVFDLGFAGFLCDA
ncbi:MAG: MBL fold metallo-hydrolase [Oscillospiraceae bacterium]|nr:MBL fold metallo-hydrolase [Oscillospiraceae bacterium]